LRTERREPAERRALELIMASLDDNGRLVLSFAAELKNLSRTAALVDEIAEMHASGRWRHYETVLGPEGWRECEFDYFLIACDVAYDDISRVLAWNRRGKDLAPSMISDDLAKRRPIEKAASSWRSPTGETLVDRAARRGWTNTRGSLRPPPVPARARTLASHGVTMDEHARQQRENQIPAPRRRELTSIVRNLIDELEDVELRYVRDQLSARLANRGRPAIDLNETRREISAAKGDLGVLAEKWGITRGSARRRIARATQNRD
jgi:hypothetical protein